MRAGRSSDTVLVHDASDALRGSGHVRQHTFAFLFAFLRFGVGFGLGDPGFFVIEFLLYLVYGPFGVLAFC